MGVKRAQKLNTKKAFTLMELVIVMAVSLVLVTMVLTLTLSISRSVTDAKLSAEREEEQLASEKFIEHWYNDNYTQSSLWIKQTTTPAYSKLVITTYGGESVISTILFDDAENLLTTYNSANQVTGRLSVKYIDYILFSVPVANLSGDFGDGSMVKARLIFVGGKTSVSLLFVSPLVS